MTADRDRPDRDGPDWDKPDHPRGIARAVFETRFQCSPALADLAAARARYHEYAARQTIIAAAQPLTQVFLALSGHARSEALSINGRLVVVEDYFSGDLFGERGLAAEASADLASEDVRAHTRACAAAFANQDFVALMTNYSAIALAFSQMLIARLARASRRLAEDVTLTANGRIHAELLRQARAGEGMTITPAPVLSAFALVVQSTRETVSRAISNLEKRGIIRRDEHRLVVIAPHRLEDLIY